MDSGKCEFFSVYPSEGRFFTIEQEGKLECRNWPADCEFGEPKSIEDRRGPRQCATCYPGHYLFEENFCIKCPSGRYFPTNADYVKKNSIEDCHHCPIHMYQPDPGQTDCFHCSPGKYTSEIASTSCQSFSSICDSSPCQNGGSCIEDETDFNTELFVYGTTSSHWGFLNGSYSTEYVPLCNGISQYKHKIKWTCYLDKSRNCIPESTYNQWVDTPEFQNVAQYIFLYYEPVNKTSGYWHISPDPCEGSWSRRRGFWTNPPCTNCVTTNGDQEVPVFDGQPAWSNGVGSFSFEVHVGGKFKMSSANNDEDTNIFVELVNSVKFQGCLHGDVTTLPYSAGILGSCADSTSSNENDFIKTFDGSGSILPDGNQFGPLVEKEASAIEWCHKSCTFSKLNFDLFFHRKFCT